MTESRFSGRKGLVAWEERHETLCIPGLAHDVHVADVAVNGTLAENAPPASANMKRLVDDNMSFALDLYRQLRSSEGNLFFSPYSVSTALALVYGGARSDAFSPCGLTMPN